MWVYIANENIISETLKNCFISKSDLSQNNLYNLQLWATPNNEQNRMFSVSDTYTL